MGAFTMKVAHGFLLVALATAGCASSLTVDYATMPPGTFASTDADEAALYEAGLAFSSGGIRPTTPQGWARAYADVEYVSGAFNAHSRWGGLDGAATAQLMIARREIRDAAGISQAAKSQAVVDALLAVGRAQGDGLMVALANPIFLLGPQATLQRLQNPPSLYTTPYAIAHTNIAIEDLQDGCIGLLC